MGIQKKVFSNVFFSLVDKAIVIIFNMFISVAVARYLGASDYGRYTFFGVVYSFVNSCACFGMAQIVTKEFAANENKQKSIFCAAIIVSVFAGLITELCIFILQLVTGFLDWLEVGILGIICLFNVCSVFYYYLTAVYQLKNIVKIKNVLIILFVSVYVFLIINKAAVEWFILAYALKECSILGAALLAFIVSKEKNKIKNQILSFHEVTFIIKKIMYLCLPLLLSGLSVTLYLKIDQVMIRGMLTERQLGIYSSGVKLVEAFYFIPTAITTGILPYFTEQYIKKKQSFWKQFEYLADGLNMLAYLFVIAIILSGKWIIQLLYGEEYADAVDVMMVSVWSVIPVCMGCVRGIYLSIMEYSGLSFLFSVSAAIVNIVMNYFLIPFMGIVGAALASIISYSVQSFVLTFFSPKLKKMAKVQARSLYGFIFLIKDANAYIKRREKMK